ncbi:MAG: hypothetical protein D6683_05375, partial [Actinomyces sp.]
MSAGVAGLGVAAPVRVKSMSVKVPVALFWQEFVVTRDPAAAGPARGTTSTRAASEAAASAAPR